MADLRNLQRNWDAFGTDDPLWAVLTAPEKRHGRWDVDEFLATAAPELELVLGEVRSAVPEAFELMPRDRALDFGCGVGRLTLGLAEHFRNCDGVDIAPSMIDEARKLASARSMSDRCSYHLNETDNLSQFESSSFDFIYTAHVLQHMEPRFARAYVHEFIRLVEPNGLVVFQIPTAAAQVELAPIPADQFAAEGSVRSAPSRLRCGEVFTIAVEYVNIGTHPWGAFSGDRPGRVELKYHWDRNHAPSAQTPAHRYGWSIGQDIPALGGVAEVELSLVAPDEPGVWLLSIDLVQVGENSDRLPSGRQVRVAIQVDRQNRVQAAVTRLTRKAARVARSRLGSGVLPRAQSIADRAGMPLPRLLSRGAGSKTAGTPVMEMHATPTPDVISWIEEADGVVLATSDWCRLFGHQPTDFERTLFIAGRRETSI